jgi:protein arginine N-methyltransferase 5
MDSYSASEDPGPTFCIGHHEANRSVAVTPQMIRRVHETNVSSQSLTCVLLFVGANRDGLV